MHVTLHAGTVTASATANTISGLLLPYGEIGHTSVGPFTVSAGAVDVPANPGSVHLNLQHDRARPIGKAARLIETPRGIEAVFSLVGIVTAADARAEVEWTDDQRRIAPFETATKGFTLVNASISWRPLPDAQNLTLSLAANNIFDVEARRHASYTKDYVPLAGRDFRITARASF